MNNCIFTVYCINIDCCYYFSKFGFKLLGISYKNRFDEYYLDLNSEEIRPQMSLENLFCNNFPH